MICRGINVVLLIVDLLGLFRDRCVDCCFSDNATGVLVTKRIRLLLRESVVVLMEKLDTNPLRYRDTRDTSNNRRDHGGIVSLFHQSNIEWRAQWRLGGRLISRGVGVIGTTAQQMQKFAMDNASWSFFTRSKQKH
jgi:hypothetical protein